MPKRKTIYDVAREAGVSISTVSRVVSGKGYVSEESRRKVEAACENYRPIASAREIKTKKSHTIAIVISHEPSYFFLNSIYTNALIAISKVAKETGYRLLLDITNEETEVFNLFEERRVDGFIFMGAKRTGGMVERLVESEIPFVIIGNYHGPCEDVCQVDINDRQAILDAANYLLDLGHRRIGIITGDQKYASCADRLQGYRDALSAAGIEISEEYIETCEDINEVKAEHLAKKMLYKQNRVTAIVAFNDMVALAVCKAAKDLNIRIPQELSVIGFDDTQMASFVIPPLTSIWQPSHEKGEKAMRVLVESLEKGELPKGAIELSCITMYRESCVPPKEQG